MASPSRSTSGTVYEKSQLGFKGQALAEEDAGTSAKPLPIPARPTPEMVKAHEVCHVPFRSWCSHCVRGHGKSFSHKAVDHSQDDEGRPVVSLDYGFFGSPGELPADAVGGQKMPVLVVRDRFTKAFFHMWFLPKA